MSSHTRVDATSAESCHIHRRMDRLYTLLTGTLDEEAHTMLQAVQRLITARSKHPEVLFVFEHAAKMPCVARAVLLYAMAIEPDFCTYMMQRADVDADALSEFVHSILGPNVEQLMNGMMSMEYFVNTCLLEYVTM